MRPLQSAFLLLALCACASAVQHSPAPTAAPDGSGVVSTSSASAGKPAGMNESARGGTVGGVAESEESGSSAKLPPIPLVTGAVAPNVVYPSPNQLIQSRDSNFIFGSVGNGKARLSINGVPVKVYPNGSFIAYLALPPSSRARYDIVATLGEDTVRITQPVRLLPPRPVLSPDGALVVDSASVTPSGGLVLGDDELVRVSVRAPSNATVRWMGGKGRSVMLVSALAPADSPGVSGLPTASIPARYVVEADRWATDIPARALRDTSRLVITRGADSVRLPIPAIDSLPRTPVWAMLGADSIAPSDTDRVIKGRPIPGGTYKWLLMPGTVVRLTGWSGAFARVRLDEGLDVWVDSADTRLLPVGWAPPARVAGNAQVVPDSAWVDLRIPMSSRPPFLVEQGDHSIALTLYGVTANTDIINFAANDSLLKEVSWRQLTAGRARYTLRLGSEPYGYLAFWDGGAFVLRVRRPPAVDPEHPLAGLTIAVDPGHPPIGATGPTGLYEADAVLAVGEKVREMLQKRGANVFMTRTTPAPVGLGDRPIMARRADANALVSIHLNALPDGVNPFRAQGTGAYFFHPQSEPLARALQNGMVNRMGLPNLGVYYDNLALARATWMPSVLCEGAFIMMPAQEAALRTSEFQTAYARGIVDGLESYFRSLAPAR
ncbi:MAG TPA: N-acetylmuramoyl-L-alanine amidase [Gemmatimonadaceae bacterium]|nr:N-acetylmuramoyl-L-alanine amidase [Gemmatimonadaceae bacterium]